MRLRKLLLAGATIVVMLASLKLISDPAFVSRWRHHSKIFGPLSVELRFIRRSQVLVQLFEGLPHPTTEKESFEAELDRVNEIDYSGHKFYDKTISMNEADASTLFRLLTTAEGFQPRLGVKFCGGFHPDWLVVFDRNGTPIECYCCFGCGEAEFHRGEESVHVDMTSATAKQLNDLLSKYRSSRPPFREF
jgi:hypothetical protein